MATIVSMMKLRNVEWFYPLNDTEKEDRNNALWFAFGRESAGDVLPYGGGVFMFADAYARARRAFRANSERPADALPHGMNGAYTEFMATGTVSAVR